MREILFKAKRLDNGEWVEGLLCKGLFSKFAIEEIGESRRRDIHPETICQFTGLTDKNGEKIFENDIINCKTTLYKLERRVVEWSQKNAMWTMRGEVNAFRMCDDFEYEVIGNIHDKEEPTNE